MTNDHEQDISVCVFNTTESTIPVAESTVGGIHVIYGNYDFSGTEPVSYTHLKNPKNQIFEADFLQKWFQMFLIM